MQKAHDRPGSGGQPIFPEGGCSEAEVGRRRRATRSTTRRATRIPPLATGRQHFAGIDDPWGLAEGRGALHGNVGRQVGGRRGPAEEGPGPTAKDLRSTAFAALTDREYEVVEAVAEGLDNAEAAARLFMSEGTVRNHISAILAKLGLRNRTQVAVMYYRSAQAG